MISNRPYLIRAIYDWIVDNGWTPHFQLDANYPGVMVPRQFVQEGMIVLNASPTAVLGLEMGNSAIGFSARFQGEEQNIVFPPEAVLAVFARENGQGMPFPPEPYPEEFLQAELDEASSGLKAVTPSKTSPGVKKARKDSKDKKRANLSVVK
ncbi:stringent starvation protein B [Thiosulfatimonas sediminis]|uniref:Stringent starvation protein B n=2 Tax=Thiosulfatimonas sediminis TaxID=2675054 RepID=A0A6F8PWX5_9GAMM|nr:stringent starvation protein B [Thiosulfatimonas sediminis]